VPRFQQVVGIRHFDLQIEAALLQCQQRIVAFIGGAVQAIPDDDDAGEFFGSAGAEHPVLIQAKQKLSGSQPHPMVIAELESAAI
jgi:hypothetical protein